MEKPKKITIVIKDDRLWKAILADVFTFGILVALVALGWFVGSSALEWIGALCWFLFVIVKATNDQTMTIEEARKRLDELEAGQ